tara:strand:- start:188 stop:649 length:462 start_codon:yes stop_codon:yes gene_type:complete
MENPNINFTNSKPLNNFSGGSVWKQGFILRIFSKTENSTNDTVYPIPVFYDKVTGKILTTTLPPEIASEYKNVSFYDVNITSGNLQSHTPPHIENQPTTQDPYFTPNEWESTLPQDPETNFESSEPNSEPSPPTLEWGNDNNKTNTEDNDFWN